MPPDSQRGAGESGAADVDPVKAKATADGTGVPYWDFDAEAMFRDPRATREDDGICDRRI
jgi:hypothetical protein